MDIIHTSHQQQAADPIYLRVQNMFFALCMLLAPLTVSLWFGLCPVYGNPNCPGVGKASMAIVGVDFRSAPSLLLQLFFVATVIASYIYPLSYIFLGRLAIKRSPWLAIIGIVCGFVGSVVWSLFAGEIFWINMLSQLGFDTQFPRFQTAYLANWGVLVMHGGWVIGHLLGYVLLGIALARARVIPLWAASLFIVSPILMGPLAYGTGQGLIQVLGYVLIFIASIPAAFAQVKTRNVQARSLIPMIE